jgi:hypothetical protein
LYVLVCQKGLSHRPLTNYTIWAILPRGRVHAPSILVLCEKRI